MGIPNSFVLAGVISIMCHVSCFNMITYRKVKKPIVKKWCYTPSENDGISTFDSLPQPGECPRKCKQVSP